MPASPSVAAQLHALSLHLGQRKDELLQRWREAVRRDPELAATAGLARGALDDHIPRILEDFEHRLRADHALQAMRVELMNLFLKYEGPERLAVEGDVLKLQRILQNLLRNVLKTTEHGGVIVRWSTDPQQRARQWTLSVCGAGPATDPGSAGPLQQALKSATEMTQAPRLRPVSATPEVADRASAAAPGTAGAAPAVRPSGEGVGLSIVKRLCEVLHATLALQAPPGRGATFHISFPLRYADDAGSDSGPHTHCR